LKTDDENCGECNKVCQGEEHCLVGNCLTSQEEICDGLDNDFDGSTDEDADGNALTNDCNNACGPGLETCSGGEFVGCTAPAGVPEQCNDLDDDCDGQTDEGVGTWYYEDYDADGYGDPDPYWALQSCTVPEPGSSLNNADYVVNDTDCNDSDPDIHPGAAEDCGDDVDNNCDGNVNETCGCMGNETRQCGTDVGICEFGTQFCIGDVWSECLEEVEPEANESCNGLDDDCDGQTDEEMAGDEYDVYLENDTCDAAVNIGAVVEVFDHYPPNIVTINGSIYKGNEYEQGSTPDVDWYKVIAEEANGHGTDCLFAGKPGATQCDFIFHANLALPAGVMPDDWEMNLYGTDNCGALGSAMTADTIDYDADADRYILMISIEIDGWICNLQETQPFFIEIKRTATDPTTCGSYDLAMEFVWDDDNFISFGSSCP
jgi:hypothetical protein